MEDKMQEHLALRTPFTPQEEPSKTDNCWRKSLKLTAIRLKPILGLLFSLVLYPRMATIVKVKNFNRTPHLFLDIWIEEHWHPRLRWLWFSMGRSCRRLEGKEWCRTTRSGAHTTGKTKCISLSRTESTMTSLELMLMMLDWGIGWFLMEFNLIQK